MPTLVTPRTRFLHIPKTGGTWVSQALPAAGVPVRELARASPGVVAAHAGLAETEDHADRFTFAFVRHPLDWWRSFWGHRMRVGWEPDHVIDSRACSEDFDEFIAQVVEHLPGHLNERFCRYVGPPEAPISFVGRFETLVDDLCAALTAAGERFDEAALRAHRAANVNDYARFPATYDAGLARELAASEAAVIARFYGDDPLPAPLVR